jgi:hypothetical protein
VAEHPNAEPIRRAFHAHASGDRRPEDLYPADEFWT